MHEASLVNDLIRKIEHVARADPAGRGGRVAGVQVRLGALCHMSAEHFREHFQHAARGTLAEGAVLDVEVSKDLDDPHAQDLLLRSVELDV
jgi:hydrogenase nickel incorporation protein HypA/HybF